MNHFFRCTACFLLHLYTINQYGQSNDSILPVIELDSFTVQASRVDELNINECISMMIHDQSFYTAFKNLRTASYDFINDILIFKKDRQSVQASYHSIAHQDYTKPCRSMKEYTVQVQGDYFDKSRGYTWYTSRLYDRLFFTHGSICIDSTNKSQSDQDRVESHIQDLKRLIFAPGTPTHVPFLGNKTAIFDADMQPYYDYHLRIDTIQNQPYYLFEVTVKPQFREKGQGKTVVKRLQTWFTIEDHQIVRRDYQLVGNTFAYSFDVTMHVDVTKVGDRFYPSFIQYDGTWKILTKKRESAKFTISFNDFKF